MSSCLTGRVKRVTGDEEGSSLVEMAMALSLLLVLVLGVIQFSYGMYAMNTVSDAAREGARWAMVRGLTSCSNTPGLSKCKATPTDIQNYVLGLGFPGLKAANMTVSTTWLSATASTPTVWVACGTTDACKARGNQVQVSVTYAFPLNLPSMDKWKIVFRPSTLNLSSSSTMVVSQ